MNAERVCLSIQRSIEVERRREGGREGKGRKPSIVVDCARQLEPNNRPPFLAERLYCERQLTAEYAHASAMPRRSARSTTHNERYARDARIILTRCYLTCRSRIARLDPGSCPSPVFPREKADYPFSFGRVAELLQTKRLWSSRKVE